MAVHAMMRHVPCCSCRARPTASQYYLRARPSVRKRLQRAKVKSQALSNNTSSCSIFAYAAIPSLYRLDQIVEGNQGLLDPREQRTLVDSRLHLAATVVARHNARGAVAAKGI
mmetsp:Transcript_7255/g.18982  ORF Transcript_7255/g.18982 Transcript_7255/m.18982 type:complete len:113 (-) Transcript_7255:519-857(-)